MPLLFDQDAIKVRNLSKKLTFFLLCIPFLMTLLVSGCSTTNHSSGRDGPPLQSVDISKIHDPIPHPLKASKYGNPPVYRIHGQDYHVMNTAKGYRQRGVASWYGTKFHGQRTSSGEPYDMFAMTGANRELPIPVFARVTNLENGRSIIVKINDRGPFAANRILDLSYVAAKKLGYAEKGTAMVEIQAITFDKPQHNHIQLAHQAAIPPAHKKYSQPAPAARLAHNSSSHHYLQVGAFRSHQNAEKLRLRIAQYTKKPVSIQATAGQHAQLYKVQIGPLAGKAESDKLLQRLRPLGINSKLTVS